MHTTPSELARFILYAAVAELADAQDLKSCGTYTPVPVRFRSAALLKSRRNVEFTAFLLFFCFKKFEHLLTLYDEIPRFRFSIKFSRKILTFKLLDRLHYKQEKEVSRNESEASVKIK